MPFYSALAAQRRAGLRRHESRKPHRMDSDRLRSWVMDALRRGWSPGLIEGRLKLEYPDDPVMRVSHECLHQWIYAKPQRDLDLRQYLPRGRKHRARRKGRKVRGPRIPMRVPISQRLCFCKLASTVWALFFGSIGGWFPAGTAPSEPAAPFSLVIWS